MLDILLNDTYIDIMVEWPLTTHNAADEHPSERRCAIAHYFTTKGV
jgi:hypothetical protein